MKFYSEFQFFFTSRYNSGSDQIVIWRLIIGIFFLKNQQSFTSSKALVKATLYLCRFLFPWWYQMRYHVYFYHTEMIYFQLKSIMNLFLKSMMGYWGIPGNLALKMGTWLLLRVQKENPARCGCLVVSDQGNYDSQGSKLFVWEVYPLMIWGDVAV